MTLYEISDDLLNAVCQTDDNGELLPGVAERLDALQQDFVTKATGICGLVRNLSAQRDAYKAEADRMAKHAKALDNQIENLKDYLQFNMERTGQDKMTAGLFKLAIQASPPAVKLAEGAEVPVDFRRMKIELDSRAVLDAHKSGVSLPACITIVNAKHLRIR